MWIVTVKRHNRVVGSACLYSHIHKLHELWRESGVSCFRIKYYYYRYMWRKFTKDPPRHIDLRFHVIYNPMLAIRRCLLLVELNPLRPRQNGRHFPDDIFKCVFLNENVQISIKISLKFVARGPINNIPALAQKMAWRRPGDKSLSGPMMVN